MSNILFSIMMENEIFNLFFTEIFISKMFSKVSNKNFGEKNIKYIIFNQDLKAMYSTAFTPKFLFLVAYIN